MLRFFCIGLCFFAGLFYIGCSENSGTSTPKGKSYGSHDGEEKFDPSPGVGRFTKVELTKPLNDSMIAVGGRVYAVKCIMCHKLNAERLTGPGWKDLSKRRTPEWIMNFLTNTDEMNTKNPTCISMVNSYFVKMPPQNLTDEEARGILEFIRQNDGEK